MSVNLYVGNLSYGTSEDQLRQLFAEFGEVQAVNLITDRDTGRPKGFGFVEMATEEAAQAAITALDGKSVDDRNIKVDRAKPRVERDRRRPRW